MTRRSPASINIGEKRGTTEGASPSGGKDDEERANRVRGVFVVGVRRRDGRRSAGGAEGRRRAGRCEALGGRRACVGLRVSERAANRASGAGRDRALRRDERLCADTLLLYLVKTGRVSGRRRFAKAGKTQGLREIGKKFALFGENRRNRRLGRISDLRYFRRERGFRERPSGSAKTKDARIFRVKCKKGIKGLSRPAQATDERNIRFGLNGEFPRRSNRENFLSKKLRRKAAFSNWRRAKQAGIS